MKSLSDLVAYRNPPLLRTFEQKHRWRFGLRPGDTEPLFEALKAFLWFAARREATGEMAPILPDDMNVLNEMWREFILRTEDYSAFCIESFGFFLHHRPSEPSNETAALDEKLREQIRRSKEDLGEDMTRQIYLGLPSRFKERKGFHIALFS